LQEIKAVLALVGYAGKKERCSFEQRSSDQCELR